MYSELPDAKGSRAPGFVYATLVLGAIVPAVSSIICAMYWAVVHDPDEPLRAISVALHGGNLLVALADFLISRRPFRLAHVYLPVAFGFTYGSFTLVYFLLGGTNKDGVSRYIYQALDWGEEPEQAFLFLVAVGFVATPLFHAVAVGIHSLAQYWQGMKTASAEPNDEVV